VARRVARGEIWNDELRKPDKRRPVVVLSRPEAIEMLTTVLVAPVTSTIHGVASEVVVGADEGLRHESAVNLDHVQVVETARLTKRLGQLDERKMRAVCVALAIATGCGER
jgi:mRNA interferase MazF